MRLVTDAMEKVIHFASHNVILIPSFLFAFHFELSLWIAVLFHCYVIFSASIFKLLVCVCVPYNSTWVVQGVCNPTRGSQASPLTVYVILVLLVMAPARKP